MTQLHIRTAHPLHLIVSDEIVLCLLLLEHCSRHIIECIIVPHEVRRPLLRSSLAQLMLRNPRQRCLGGLFACGFRLLCLIVDRRLPAAAGARIAAGRTLHGIRRFFRFFLGRLCGLRPRIGTRQLALHLLIEEIAYRWNRACRLFLCGAFLRFFPLLRRACRRSCSVLHLKSLRQFVDTTLLTQYHLLEQRDTFREFMNPCQFVGSHSPILPLRQ